MKKLLFIPLIVISSSVFAQTFQFGLKAGVNATNFTGTTFEGAKNKAIVGFHGGAFLSFLLGNHVAIQPEAYFSTQGSRITRVGEVAKDYRVSYINVPVNLKVRFNGGFYIEAGPQVGFKLNEDVPDGDGGAAEDFARDLDLAVNAGIGYHSKIGLGIGGRYVVGVTKVGNADNADVSNTNFRNGVAQLFIFYTLFNNRNNP